MSSRRVVPRRVFRALVVLTKKHCVRGLSTTGPPASSSAPVGERRSLKDRGLVGGPAGGGLGRDHLRAKVRGALCAKFGADATMGEMIMAKFLLKRDAREMARLRRHASEGLYGAQIATNSIEEGTAAIKVAHEAGVDWVDLNCGCPILEGSVMMMIIGWSTPLNRNKLRSELPVSVKLRLSPYGNADENYLKHVAALRGLEADAAPAFLTLHGRTAMARYHRRADWAKIEAAALAAGPAVPLVGNGDVLTHYEADMRRAAAPSGAGFMIGRGALICPWIFQDLARGETWCPTAAERVEVYFELASNMKQHFGDDARGRRAAFYFLPWHFDFFHRWRPWTEAAVGDLALAQPLIQSSREIDTRLEDLGQAWPDLDPLEALLRCANPEAFPPISHALWDASSVRDAVEALTELATSENLADWRLTSRPNDDESEGHDAPKLGEEEKKKKKLSRKQAQTAALRKPKGDPPPEGDDSARPPAINLDAAA